MKLRNAAVGCAVLGAFASASAWGSGFYLLEQNASGLGRAFAGTAAIADDPSTVFYNPAGLARLDGVRVSVAASAINVNTRFDDAASVEITATAVNIHAVKKETRSCMTGN